jgi:type IX secretion system PorP/SprF family membrane protein
MNRAFFQHRPILNGSLPDKEPILPKKPNFIRLSRAFIPDHPELHDQKPQACCLRPKKPNLLRMKKYYTFILILLAVAGRLQAQQSPLYTLYMMNPFLVNPAIAGTHSYYQIRSNHRFQWAGFTDAPITNSISAFGPHSKKDMGFGGTISSDITGPTSRTSLKGVYAYNVKLNSDIRISMGMSLGVIQYKIDGTKIDLGDGQDDKSLEKTVISKFLPDASVGVYVWSQQFFGGFSADQLLNNKFKTGPDDLGLSKLSSHFYLVGGYIYTINREWSVEPTMILKKVVPSPFQLELDCKVIYNKMLWGGLAFRTQESLSILMGYTYQKKFYFAYAFDLALNDIKQYTLGSHEIVIGINFNSIKKVSRRRK